MIYEATLAAVFLSAVFIFPVLIFIPAPYGRHRRKGWGPEISARAAWTIMEAPSPIAFVLMFFLHSTDINFAQSVPVAMYLGHYIWRSFIFPFRMREKGQKKPLLTVLMAILFNVANGSLNGFALAALAPHLTADWLTMPWFLLGTALFVTGLCINHWADFVLRQLRKPGETSYHIPRGGLYERISCPNYFGEILEWCGYALTSLTLPALAFAVFTFANLFPRALTHHRWYREKFEDYPTKRKAIIPFII